MPTVGGNYVITAEAIRVGNTIASTSSPINLSVLTVLYDKLGGPGNWGWSGSDTLFQTYFEELDESNQYIVSTQFEGTLASNFSIHRIEFAVDYFNDNTGIQIPLDTLQNCKIKVWDMNIYSFQDNASTPSLSNTSPGSFTAGSTTVPAGNNPGPSGDRAVYVVGWDNLNINLPGNTPLQMSIQCPVNTAAPNVFTLYKSVFTGTFTRFASRLVGGSQNNATLNGNPCIKILGN